MPPAHDPTVAGRHSACRTNANGRRAREGTGRDDRNHRDNDRIGRAQQDARIREERARAERFQRERQHERRIAEQRAAQRHRQLQQQRRMAQYHYQQQYHARLQAQQRRWLGVSYNYYNDPFYYTPASYRYSYGGHWHQTNRYGADLMRRAVSYGYEGLRAVAPTARTAGATTPGHLCLPGRQLRLRRLLHRLRPVRHYSAKASADTMTVTTAASPGHRDGSATTGWPPCSRWCWDWEVN